MKIFISGATGYIGSLLALRLAGEGNTIHALYRSESKTAAIRHPNIVLYKGNILDLQSLEAAMSGCEQVYHTAAFAKAWNPDPSLIYRLNIEGSINIILAGIKSGVEKFVFTSTAGVYGPSGLNLCLDESSPAPKKYFIDYETSKAVLEKILFTFSKSGIDCVIVNPCRVYGPGILSESNGVTRMIKAYMEGRWRIIPGDGKSLGNYVHVEDVVTGHILAMQKGVSGERYILGGENVSFNDFFSKLAVSSGKNQKMFHLPLWIMLFLSHVILFFAKITGNTPLITPPLVNRYIEHWSLSSAKSINKLGYDPMNLEAGLKDTLKWLMRINSPEK